MKLKNILVAFVLILSLAFMFSCGDTPEECTVHTDDDGDGKCDVCKAEVEPEEKPEEKPEQADLPELTLIEGGATKYQFVISKSDLGATVKKSVDTLVKTLDDLGVETEAVTESETNATEYEIFIGVPTLRGEVYEREIHELGPDGYVIKIIGTKVLIAAGSEETLVETIDMFAKDYLGIDKKTKELENVVIKSSQDVEYVQTEYRVTALKLDGVDMRDYTIAANTTDSNVKAVAENIQNVIYMRSGYWLSIVPIDEADKSIVVKLNENTWEGNGFYVSVKDGQLVFECEFKNKYLDAVSAYLANKVTIITGEINFTQKTHKASTNVRDIYYEDFGAKGNGVTDDFKAIRECHEYANKWGHNVTAKSTSVFYIGNGHGTSTITVNTNTNWNNCKFIIDDSNVPSDSIEREVDIFKVLPDGGAYTVVTDKFAHVTKDNPLIGDDENETKNIGFAPGTPCMFLIISSERKQYIRYGNNADDGYSQQEIILVDAEGNIDPTTPLMWDYTMVTSAYRYTTSTERAITIGNARIEKISNRAPADYTYSARGIEIRRSNTIVDKITYDHIGDMENLTDPYNGLISVHYCDNVTVRNYTFDKPKSYDAAGTSTSMGSYSINSKAANNVVLENLLQTNYFRNDDGSIKIYSAHGSNYCKNMYVRNSKMAYLDAHKGTYNVTVTDTEIANVNMIGEGTILLENVTYTGADGNTEWGYGIAFRQDYGATWKGDVMLKNITFVMDKATKFSLIRSGGLTLNHDFGYQCYFPERFVIDGARIVDANGNKRTGIDLYFAGFLTNSSYAFGDISDPGVVSNPYMPCKEIIIKNFDLTGINFVMTDIPFFTNHTKLYIDLDLDGEAELIEDWASKYGHKKKK